MNDTRAGSHPMDGDLVRYMDHQVDAEERRGMLAHLSGCDECALRIRTLGDQSRVVTGYLAELHGDVTADEMTRARALSAARSAAARRRPLVSNGWFRAAAVAAVVIGTVGVSPVRAWVLDRIAAISGDEAPRAPAVVQPAPVVGRGSQIAFEPVGEVFNLDIEAEQAVGAVVLTLGGGSRVSAQVVGGSESFTLLPSGVLIENTAASTSSYEIAVPSSVRIVQVFAGTRLVGAYEVDASSGSWSRTIPLAPR